MNASYLLWLVDTIRHHESFQLSVPFESLELCIRYGSVVPERDCLFVRHSTERFEEPR
jgi:hypothetical protein